MERIQAMECALNEASNAVRKLRGALERYERACPLIQRLKAYYESPRWLKDYDDDQAGKLPKELRRGVLTEDAVYDLLGATAEAERIMAAMGKGRISADAAAAAQTAENEPGG